MCKAISQLLAHHLTLFSHTKGENEGPVDGNFVLPFDKL